MQLLHPAQLAITTYYSIGQRIYFFVDRAGLPALLARVDRHRDGRHTFGGMFVVGPADLPAGPAWGWGLDANAERALLAAAAGVELAHADRTGDYEDYQRHRDEQDTRHDQAAADAVARIYEIARPW